MGESSFIHPSFSDQIGMSKPITEPTLLIDEAKCKANISKMVDKARSNALGFRPHFKTHQSRRIGYWFREMGVSSITVSSFGMAEYFADDGWNDITVAFPANILKIDEINRLASKIRLNLLVDNIHSATVISEKLEHEVGIFIEVDTGSGRTGIPHHQTEKLRALAGAIFQKDHLNLLGIYSHAGHSYQARSEKEILTVFKGVTDAFCSIEQELGEFGQLEYCMGDTPTCSLATEFPCIHAISPGNFVFYDVMQSLIGACDFSQVAVVMACPVVSKNEQMSQVCIHGGAVHFSKDQVLVNGKPEFGKIVKLTKEGWTEPLDGCFVKALSQEHGIVQMSIEEFKRYDIGDVIGVLPVHSCLTAEAMGSYQTLEGEAIDHFAQKNRDTIPV